MRRLTPLPSKSVEILVLESPEVFARALLARPPLADQNYIIARDRDESLRRFALRAVGRVRRMLKTPNHIASISYLFGGGDADILVRTRLLRALVTSLCLRGAFNVVGPNGSAEALLGYLDALSPRLPGGARIESRLSPGGWTIMSAEADQALSSARS